MPHDIGRTAVIQTGPQAVSFDLDETLRDGRDFQLSIVRTCRQVAAMQPGLDAGRLVEAIPIL